MAQVNMNGGFRSATPNSRYVHLHTKRAEDLGVGEENGERSGGMCVYGFGEDGVGK